ncbi:MAG: amino-acid N-acetyltransferase [Microbacteriaceae bacterium]|nr:amino-acid N-acetyltransferase [Microbacteriaceae bacterium]
MSKYRVRPARTKDVPWMRSVMEPLVESRILLGKELVQLYEAIQEFLIAVDNETDEPVGFGALHVFWEDLGEVRTLAVHPDFKGTGAGKELLKALEERAKDLGLRRLFCLTFEVEFFRAADFHTADEDLVPPEVYAEIVRSPDDGVAEFLDLARVKQNTLGNSRMLKVLA